MSVNNGIQNNGIQKSEDLDRLFDDFKKTIKTNSEQKTAMQDSFCDTKSLSNKQKRYDSIHVQNVLQKTYHLNGTDAKNVQAFVNALDEYIDEQIKKCSNTDGAETWGTGGAGIVEDIKRERKSSEKLKENIAKNTNITVGFLTKLKSLCAKIASFFGDNSKLEKLQNEGLAQFNDLKKCLKVKQESQHFIESFMKANADKSDVIDGLMKIFKSEVLDIFKSEVLDGSLKIKDKNLLLKDSFVKSIDVNNKKELEGFAKAFLLADTQGAMQAISSNLERKFFQSEKDKQFSPKCMLFEDIARGYSCSFTIGDKNVNITAHTKNSESFKTIEDVIKNESLPETARNALKDFCAKFSSQGVFACKYPNTEDIFPLGEGKINFSVKIDDNGDTHVNVVASQNSTNGGYLPSNFPFFDDVVHQQLELPVKIESKFSFTYKGGIVACEGAATNIVVQDYQRTDNSHNDL